jgi:nucleoside-diphosphate-sugar epimerase
LANILITGGLGFIGRNLAISLSKNSNNKVSIFDNSFRKNLTDLKIPKNIKIINGDIKNFELLKRSLKNIDTVFHLAFINGTKYFYTQPKLVLDVGIKGTLNLFDAIEKSKVKKIILASSSEIYQTPKKIPTPEEIEGSVPDVKNPRYSYGSAKLICEILLFHYLKRKNLKKIIFRPHNIYGPAMGFEHVIPELIKNMITKSNKLKTKNISLSIQGTGLETRSFCYIDDAVEAIKLISKKGINNEIYNIGTNEEINIKNLVYKISKKLNLNLKIVSGKLRKGSTLRRRPDIKKIKKLGHENKFNLSLGLKPTVDWYKKFFLK